MSLIFIVEDDELLAKSMEKALGAHGYKVAVYLHTDEALEHLKKTRPDLVILDVMFPGNKAGGFEFARKVKELSETSTAIPVLMLSAINQEYHLGFSDKDIDREWMPVAAFIDKPVDMSVLLSNVDDLLERVAHGE